MTMWRSVDELDFGAMSLTAAETVEAEQGFFGMSRLVISTRHRARWEQGYTAGLHNAQYGSRMFDQLRTNEQQIAAQGERIGELTAQLAEARAWAKAWKMAAKDKRDFLLAFEDLAMQQGEHIDELWETIEGQQLQPATASDTAAQPNPARLVAEDGQAVDAVTAGSDSE